MERAYLKEFDRDSLENKLGTESKRNQVQGEKVQVGGKISLQSEFLKNSISDQVPSYKLLSQTHVIS
jgi:hypothetical protein